MGILEILFIIFLVMKLAGIGVVANWPWLWVFAPLIPAAIIWVIVLAILFVGSAASILAIIFPGKKRY